jgi:preprotein translocase subunit SecY
MKRFIESIRNIFQITELRNKILLTLLLLLVYRIGAHVVLPGVNTEELAKESANNTSGLFGILNTFSGGAFSTASVFALGVMPYITASIIIQLLGLAVPYFQKLQKEGESGRTKMNNLTRFLTIGICLVQGTFYIAGFLKQGNNKFFDPNPSFFYFAFLGLILTAGTMFVLWLGEKIQDKGIGNGVSIIIMTGILARLPEAIGNEFSSKFATGGGGPMLLIVELVALFLIIMFIILIVQGVRRVPLSFARKIVSSKQTLASESDYLPLKVNAAGVMPIIFAQAIIVIPAMLLGMFESETTTALAQKLSDQLGFWYNIIIGILILVFTYFYTAMYISPAQMADDIKGRNGYVPGVKPGDDTKNYIDDILTKITLPGAIFLAIIAILPSIAQLVGVNNQFAVFFGGTSILIAVGVILDTLQQIETYLINKEYDGLMKTGRIKGRNPLIGRTEQEIV